MQTVEIEMHDTAVDQRNTLATRAIRYLLVNGPVFCLYKLLLDRGGLRICPWAWHGILSIVAEQRRSVDISGK